MDVYHVWCDLKPGVGDLDFAAAVERYMAYLKGKGLIQGHRLTRGKLGLGVRELGQFHLMIDVLDLAQLEQAFSHVASRAEPVESAHHGVNSLIRNATFALYRDFPDPVRQRGEEKF